MSDYANTFPSLECQAWANDCTAAFPTNSTAQFVCQHVNCGTKNVSEASVSSSSSASPSSTSASSSSGTQAPASATSDSTAPTSTGGAMPVGISREASTGLAGAILFGFFSFFL